MPIEYKVIGRHIRAARNRLKMTQEDVAEAINMSSAHFGKVERGERPINLNRLSQLATLLQAPLETLVEGSAINEDGSTITLPENVASESFSSAMADIAKGCSEPSLRLMLRLCADVAEADKTSRSH